MMECCDWLERNTYFLLGQSRPATSIEIKTNFKTSKSQKRKRLFWPQYKTPQFLVPKQQLQSSWPAADDDFPDVYTDLGTMFEVYLKW
jgi:hypothetical protein